MTIPLGCPTSACTGVRPMNQGDDFTSPVQMFGSGTATLPLWACGGQEDEPNVWPYADVNFYEADEGVWINYLPADDGTLTLTTTDTLIFFEYGWGSDIKDWNIVGSGRTGTVVPVSKNVPMFIRVRADSGYDALLSTTFTYTFAAAVPAMVVTVLSDLEQTPGTFRIKVANGVPGATVTFASGAATIPPSAFDEYGTLVSYAVLIDDARAAGSYTLTVSSTSRADATASFNVLKNAPTSPLAQPADSSPVAVALVGGVRKWALQDPAPAGEQYVFEINPDSATSPFPLNVFTSDVTTAPDGQHLTWEGAQKPVTWTFKGTLLTQTQLDALRRFSELNRRVYLIDNRNRAWVVSVDSFDPEPKRVLDNPWAHTYTVICTIYKGPVTPV